MNIKNFERVLKQIKKNPRRWDQGHWHCGTKHCFAGWAQILAGKEENGNTACDDAQNFLDIPLGVITTVVGNGIFSHCVYPKESANYLFASDRTINDFEKVLANAKASRPPIKKKAKTKEQVEVAVQHEEEQHVMLSR